MVVPVPTILERDQIHVGDRALLDHLDAFTSPRLVEYHDANPCAVDELRTLGYLSDSAKAPAALRRDAAPVGRRSRRPHRGQVQRRRVRDPHPLGRSRARASRPGCAPTATAFPRAPRTCCAATCARGSTSSSPRSTSSASASSASRAAPVADGVREPALHAAHPSRHGERGRTAGALRLRPVAPRSRRAHQLPHHPPALRRQRSGLRQRGVPATSTATSSAITSRRSACARSCSSTRGTWRGAIPAPPTR